MKKKVMLSTLDFMFSKHSSQFWKKKKKVNCFLKGNEILLLALITPPLSLGWVFFDLCEDYLLKSHDRA